MPYRFNLLAPIFKMYLTISPQRLSHSRPRAHFQHNTNKIPSMHLSLARLPMASKPNEVTRKHLKGAEVTSVH